MLSKIEIVNDEKNSLLVQNERLFYEAVSSVSFFFCRLIFSREIYRMTILGVNIGVAVEIKIKI